MYDVREKLHEEIMKRSGGKKGLYGISLYTGDDHIRVEAMEYSCMTIEVVHVPNYKEIDDSEFIEFVLEKLDLTDVEEQEDVVKLGKIVKKQKKIEKCPYCNTWFIIRRKMETFKCPECKKSYNRSDMKWKYYPEFEEE